MWMPWVRSRLQTTSEDGLTGNHCIPGNSIWLKFGGQKKNAPTKWSSSKNCVTPVGHLVIDREMEDENVSVLVLGCGRNCGSPHSLVRRECMSLRGTRFKSGLADAHVVRPEKAIPCAGGLQSYVLVILNWPTEPGSSALLCVVFRGSDFCD